MLMHETGRRHDMERGSTARTPEFLFSHIESNTPFTACKLGSVGVWQTAERLLTENVLQ
jgi:hypothetical protein